MTLHQFRRFDIFREIPPDLTESTVLGAATSITAMVLMTCLFFNEFVAYLTPEMSTVMFVDPNIDARDISAKLVINMDISMPGLPCSLVSVDTQDVMRSHKSNTSELVKTNLDSDGNPKSVFVAGSFSKELAGQFKGKGCRISGKLQVNKVPGDFHVCAHGHEDLFRQHFDANHPMNMSHIIHHLSFGERVSIPGINSAFSPLDEVVMHVPPSKDSTAHIVPTSFEYYIKIVPTIYHDQSGHMTKTNQYTANSNILQGHLTLPALYFRYDLSPITVQFTQRRQSFLHFIVQVCAIVGGVFTVLGLVSRFLHKSLTRVLKKARYGKLG